MRAILVGIVLSLAGCSSLTPAGNCAAWQEMAYCLQPTSAIAPFSALQKIELHRAGRTETLIVSLEADQKGLRLAGLTPLGQKVMQAVFDNRDLTVEAALPEGDALGRQILALVQLVWWPTQAVRQGLPSGGPLLEEEPGRRRLVRDGRQLLAISYDGSGQVAVEDSTLGLDIRIEDLEGQKP